MTLHKPDKSPQPFAKPSSLTLVAVAVAICYIIFQIRSVTSVAIHLDLPDNDDLMRMLSVRNWLSGQSWFDMTQHNLMPPEGLSLHWSRYVDAGIAGLQLIFRLVLAPREAEGLSALLWPGLLFFVFMATAAQAMARTYGWQAASFTLMSLAVLVVFPFNYFQIGRVDHHNVQMTLMMVSAVCLLRNHRPIKSGLLSGTFAALSLAVGLESIFFYAATGFILLGFAVMGIPHGRQQLLGFGLGLGLAAPLFFAGQTSVELWTHAQCDVLSTPVLSVTSCAMAFALAFYVLSAPIESILNRLLIVLPLGGICIALIWPQLAACADGPYGNLPKELHSLVFSRISETRPVTERPEDLALFLFPAVASIIAATYVLTSTTALNYCRGQRKSAWMLVVLSATMTIGMMFQVRFVTSVYAIVPLVFGFAVSAFFRTNTNTKAGSRIRKGILGLLLISVFLSLPMGVTIKMLFDDYHKLAVFENAPNSSRTKNAQTIRSFERDCRKSTVLTALNAIPSGRVLSSINLGPAIALHTHHLVLAAPYHRNVAAVDNGLRVIFLSEEDFLDALELIGADFLVVCQESNYGPNAIANALAAGETRPWAKLVSVGEGPLRMFRLQLPNAQK